MPFPSLRHFSCPDVRGWLSALAAGLVTCVSGDATDNPKQARF